MLRVIVYMNHEFISTSVFLHVDMNSYFATVEQQANPFLRGKAVGVCAYLQPRGCIIAASIEAKALGMKVGMRVDEAKKLIPNAVFVENDPAKYRSVTSRVFAILHELSDCVEHYSIDEAFLDMTGWVRDPAEAAWLAIKARERIRRDVGEWLSCSIGIAPTRFLAKLASDREKPSGLVIITPENLEEILATMELEDIWGVGRRMKARLEALGYPTPLAVKRAPVANLMQAFGINGYLLWAHLNGTDIDHLTDPHTLPKSVGHSYCVPKRPDVQKKARSILAKLAEKAARRLRGYGLHTCLVFVGIAIRSVDTPYHHPWSREGESLSVRLDEPLSDSHTLVHAALQLLDQLWDGRASLSFLSVTYTDLVPPSDQLSFLRDQKSEVGKLKRSDRRSLISDLSSATDRINDKYGERTIAPGMLFGVTNEDAPDRIGFRKTEGITVEPP
jgi:nucleotidyltransferase/DNA polymerase involved in DNA repair